MKKIFLITTLIISILSLSADDIDSKKQRITQIEKEVKNNEKKISTNNTNINNAKKSEASIKKQITELNNLITKLKKETTELENKYIKILKDIGKNDSQIQKSLKEIDQSNFTLITNKGNYSEIVSLWDKLKKAKTVSNISETKVKNARENKLSHDLSIILATQANYIKTIEKYKKQVEEIKKNTEKEKKENQKEANEVNRAKKEVLDKRKELDNAKKEKDKAVLELQQLQKKLSTENSKIATTNKNLVAEKKKLESQIKAIIEEALRKEQKENQQKIDQIKKSNLSEKDKEQSIEALSRESKGTGKLIIPMSGTVVVKYGQEKLEGLKSNGIEIKGKIGQEIKAADSGTVIFTGTLNGLGSVVIIDHGDVVTVYGNLATVRVSKKTKVTKGQVIGTLGRESISKEPRLYFETRKGVVIVNPLTLL